MESTHQWTHENPVAGQYNVTALLISELFEGNLITTPVQGGLHFRNRIQDEAADFTASQFEQPIDYRDQAAKRIHVHSGSAVDEYQASKKRFLLEFSAQVSSAVSETGFRMNLA